MAMNPVEKAKWVAALKSGNFPQAGGALKTDEGFCCLGVLCEVSGLGEWEKEKTNVDVLDSESQMGYPYSKANTKVWEVGNSSAAILPSFVVSLVWLESDNPYVSIPEELLPEINRTCELTLGLGAKVNLTLLNDHKVPFPLIAQLIERDVAL